MTQIATMLSDAQLRDVLFFDNPIAFATALAACKGSSFIVFDAEFNMDQTDKDGKLKYFNKNKRGTKGKTAEPNPFLGKGLRKLSHVQVTVNFNYEKKVENRGGEAPTHKGNWSQAVIVNGKVTPLSTHKDDILTELTTDKTNATLDEAGNIIDCLANRRVVLSADGNIQFMTPTPRFYLRAEIVRTATADGDKRADGQLHWVNKYVYPDGTELDAKALEDYLPAKTERTDETDFVVIGSENLVELRFGGQVWRRRSPISVNIQPLSV